MAGIWVRAGTVTLTNGSKKVTGSGTAWNTGTNKVGKGCAFIYNNIAYEVDYINSDTELYLVDTYGGATGSGLSYRIQIAVTDTIPELASRIATALAYWNGQAANLQALTTGSGNVTLTAPDGTQVTIPSYSNMQPKDALLTALAALTTAADKLVYFTGADTVDQTTLTSFARTLLDDIDAATARTTLGAQASDATLTALAGVTTSADKLIYATGSDTFSTSTLTSFARTLLDDNNAATALGTLGAQPVDATLTALAAVVTAADKLIYATGVDTFSTATLTSFARTVLAGTDAAAMLATLGITKASTTETNARIATDRVVTPASLNAVVPYTPTVNASLDLDFAKQKYKWYAGSAGITESNSMTPLITFSRSSTATYFDAMGVMKQAAVDTPRIDYDPLTGECSGLLVEEQRTNLFPYSAYPAATSAAQGWNRINCDVYPNVAVAPDGTMTAAKAVVSVGAATTGNDGVGVFATPSVTSSATHTLTLYVKDAGAGYLRIRESVNTGQIAKVNLTTGAITAEAGYTTTTFTVATTNVGNGWWRVAVVRTPTTTFGFNLKPGIDVGDGVSGIYVWGAQVEAGAFPTSYIPTPAVFSARASSATYYDSNGVVQTAASGVARSNAYDYDSDGVLRPIGLLLESAATNLLTYSEQFDNAVWTKYESSITANATTAPDGNVTADKIVENTNSNFHYISQTVPCNASTTYTMHARLKQGGRTWCRFRISMSSGTTVIVYFDLVNGVYSSSTILGTITPLIKKSANGFYNCSATFTTGSSDTSITSRIDVASDDGVVSYAGDGTSGIYIWGAQLEAGNYATSYIQTTSAQVTRVADSSTSAQTTRAVDSAVISGKNFSQWFNANELSAQTEFFTTHVTSKNPTRVFEISDGTTDNELGIFSTNSGVMSSLYQVDGVQLSTVNDGSGVLQAIGKNKYAISYKTGSFVRGYSSNGIGGEAAISTRVLKFNVIYLGNRADMQRPLNGHIRKLSIYPKALSLTELQAMTA